MKRSARAVVCWLQHVSNDDGGFSLIETIVALAIATTIFTALAYSAASAITTSQVARQNQQAVDMANAQIEQVRLVGWGALGNGTTGVTCPDPNLTNCTGAPSYNGESLFRVVGGIPTTSAPQTSNGVVYTVRTYITKPADTTGDYRRVTVVVTWGEYGKQRSKTASTVIAQSTRGLPLPDFRLTPVGATTITLAPGAKAAFGFKVTNQGAPDTWNINPPPAGGAFAFTFYKDDGNDAYNADGDYEQIDDHTGDSVVDTDRLEPQDSMTIWAVYQVPVNATSGTTTSDISVVSASQPTMAGAKRTLTETLVVTTQVVTASPTPSSSPSGTGSSSPSPSPTATAVNPTCSDPNPANDPAAVTGYTPYAYTLHNSGNTAWPSLPLPGTDPVPGSVPLRPMVMNLNANAIPAARALPEYSLSDTSQGRVLLPGGSYASTDARYVADFQSPNKTKTYTGSIVVRTFVDQVSGTDPVSLAAQVYPYRSSGNKDDPWPSIGPVTRTPPDCNGFQKVTFTFPISGSVATGTNYVLGVRIWNTGSSSVRLAYDHADYPSTVTVMEK